MFNNNKIFVFVIAIIGTIGLVLNSCQSNSNSSTGKNVADSLRNKSTTNASHDMSDSSDIGESTSPMQPITIFKNAGLVYMSGLTNPIKGTDNYNSTYSQAVNMGVYGTDFTYCMFNKQSQQALNYLQALQSLTERLGFGSAFDSKTIAKRYRNNINSEDTITNILADMLMASGNYLTSIQKKYITSLVFTGAWVESMYIGSKVYAVKKIDKECSRIQEQMNILGNLIKMLDVDKSKDTHITELISLLKPIENNFNGFEEVKKYNPDSDYPVNLTEAHIAELAKEIQDLREKLINS